MKFAAKLLSLKLAEYIQNLTGEESLEKKRQIAEELKGIIVSSELYAAYSKRMVEVEQEMDDLLQQIDEISLENLKLKKTLKSAQVATPIKSNKHLSFEDSGILTSPLPSEGLLVQNDRAIKDEERKVQREDFEQIMEKTESEEYILEEHQETVPAISPSPQKPIHETHIEQDISEDDEDCVELEELETSKTLYDELFECEDYLISDCGQEPVKLPTEPVPSGENRVQYSIMLLTFISALFFHLKLCYNCSDEVGFYDRIYYQDLLYYYELSG